MQETGKVYSLFVDKDGYVSETPPSVISDKPKRKPGRPKGSGKKKKSRRYKRVIKSARKYQPVNPDVQDDLRDLVTTARLFGITLEEMAHVAGINRETIRSFGLGTFGKRRTKEERIARLVSHLQDSITGRILEAQKVGILKMSNLVPAFKKDQLRKTKVRFKVTGISEEDQATDLGSFTLSLNELVEAQAERYRGITEKHGFRKSIVEVFVDDTRRINQ